MKAYTDYRKDLVSVRDRMGERLYQDDCQELIDDRQEIYDILAEKYEELNNELNSGGIEQGTEKWYEVKEELIGIKSEMINCANAVEDLSCCSAAQQVGCPVRTVTIFWSSRLLPMILRFPCRYLPGIPCLSLRQRLDRRRVSSRLVLPMPLPPEVARGRMIFPLMSYCSMFSALLAMAGRTSRITKVCVYRSRHPPVS